MKKKKYRYLAEAKFDEETGNSYAIINTELGQFVGSANCSPEDVDYCSKFFGCGLAELRANIKYWRLKRTCAKAKYRAIEEAINTAHAENSDVPLGLLKLKDKYEAEIENCNDAIDLLFKEINDSISKRDRAMRLDRRRKSKLTKNEIK